jgi:lysophospholipase L1-like esterase
MRRARFAGSQRSASIGFRRLLVRLAVAAVAVIFAALAVEGAVRIAFPDWAPRTARLTDFWRYDARYGWSHIPGATGTFRSYGIDAQVIINAKGYRGAEVPYSRNPGHPRVVFLGDSYTWGYGVNVDDTFAARLERLLPGVETVNLSVSGYATDQELLVYRDEGRKYHADLVVVVVADNDNIGNARTVEYGVYGKPAFVLEDGRLKLINQPVAQPNIMARTFTRLAWRSYVLTQIHREIYELTAGDSRGHATATPARTASLGSERVIQTLSHNWALTTEELAQLARDIREDGSEPLVVFADGIRAAPLVARSLAAQGIDSVTLDDVIDQNDPALHLPDALHWSPRGHARVAEVLLEPIREKLARSRR